MKNFQVYFHPQHGFVLSCLHKNKSLYYHHLRKEWIEGNATKCWCYEFRPIIEVALENKEIKFGDIKLSILQRGIFYD